MLLGPDGNGAFVPVRVKSIHCKRVPVKQVKAGQVGAPAARPSVGRVADARAAQAAGFALHKVRRTSIRTGMVCRARAAAARPPTARVSSGRAAAGVGAGRRAPRGVLAVRGRDCRAVSLDDDSPQLPGASVGRRAAADGRRRGGRRAATAGRASVIDSPVGAHRRHGQRGLAHRVRGVLSARHALNGVCVCVCVCRRCWVDARTRRGVSGVEQGAVGRRSVADGARGPRVAARPRARALTGALAQAGGAVTSPILPAFRRHPLK